MKSTTIIVFQLYSKDLIINIRRQKETKIKTPVSTDTILGKLIMNQSPLTVAFTNISIKPKEKKKDQCQTLQERAVAH